jgi:hypothetical protein
MKILRRETATVLPGATRARSALRQGLGALLDDCERGRGLLGSVTSSPNPYLTGLALFRLGYLADRHSDLAELVALMVDGLSRSFQEYGWEDFSVPVQVRPATRLRTILRCAAGLARASTTSINIPDDLLENSVYLTETLVTSSGKNDLDSPDYACGLISILLVRTDVDLDSMLDDIRAENQIERSRHIEDWRKEIQSLVGRLRPLSELGIPGYKEVIDEYQNRLMTLS